MHFSNTQLNWDEIPKHHELALQPVQPSYKKILFIERLIWGLLLSGGITVALIWVPFLQKPLWIIAGISLSVLLIAALFFTAIKSYQNMGFALRKHDLVFRKGWLFENLHIVPLKKIQHCELKRGPLERNYGLASLKIFTAGSIGADVTLRGLRYEDAGQLKDWLISEPGQKIVEVIEKDTHDAGIE